MLSAASSLLAQCYRDFYRNRLALVELIPLAKHYPILFVGWMSDEQLLALMPPQEPRMQERYMKYSWFKTQLVGKIPPRPTPFVNIAHPGMYLDHAGTLFEQTAMPIVLCMDQVLIQLGVNMIPDLVVGKLDHLPAVTAIKTWADELQAYIWGRRIRPADDNFRTIYAIFNHQVHASNAPYKEHPVDGRCCCVDCLRHNPICRCTNCIEYRKAQMTANYVRVLLRQ